MNLPCIVLLILIPFLTTACGSMSASTPTPRPTYTSYPTFTPIPTDTPYTTSTPLPSATGSTSQNNDTSPTNAGTFVEMEGQKEWFFGSAKAHVEKGRSEFQGGRYEAAIYSFKRAQEFHDKPSAVLENWIGLSYQELGEYKTAIHHHSVAIKIYDAATERANRGLAYVYSGQCGPAGIDAKIALEMEPQSTIGIHTDAEANYILASCYAYEGNYLQALQHAEAASQISIENEYENDVISEREAMAEQIRQSLDPNQPYTEFFIGTALIAYEQGMEKFGQGDYQAAIQNFGEARDYHLKPSTVLESLIGLSYQYLEEYDLSILHFTNAIDVDDNAVDRIHRSWSYLVTARYDQAIGDAKIALSMKPHVEKGYHTKAEANWVLADSHLGQGDYRAAYEYAEAVLNSAVANNYSSENIAALNEYRDLAESMVKTQK